LEPLTIGIATRRPVIGPASTDKDAAKAENSRQSPPAFSNHYTGVCAMSARIAYSALALSLFSLSPIAFAQNADLTSASVNTCNVKGSVSITVLGVTTTLPITCINPSQETAAGNDEDSTTGNVNVGVPGVVNVADLAAPYGESNYVNGPNETSLVGATTVDDASLVQDVIAASGVRGLLICESTTGEDSLRCSAGTEIAQLLVNGQAVVLPPSPIPLNYPVAVAGGAVQITVPGLGLLVSVPVSGSLTLNEVITHGAGTQQLTVEHAPLHARLDGQVTVAGIGIIKLTIDAVDYSSFDYSWEETYEYTVVKVVSSNPYFACLSPGGTCSP
jgi:hypothetical protein